MKMTAVFKCYIFKKNNFQPYCYLPVFSYFQILNFRQDIPCNLISLVKGPLEYISDLELPNEQLIEITASDGETQLNEGSDASLSNSVIAQEVSSYYTSKYLLIKTKRKSLKYIDIPRFWLFYCQSITD